VPEINSIEGDRHADQLDIGQVGQRAHFQHRHRRPPNVGHWQERLPGGDFNVVVGGGAQRRQLARALHLDRIFDVSWGYCMYYLYSGICRTLGSSVDDSGLIFAPLSLSGNVKNFKNYQTMVRKNC
jgi:hypothetical protein